MMAVLSRITILDCRETVRSEMNKYTARRIGASNKISDIMGILLNSSRKAKL